MNFRLTITLTALLLLLVSGFFFIRTWQANHAAAADNNPKNLVLNPAPADIKSITYSEDGKTRLTFVNAPGTLSASPGGSTWRLTAPINAAADLSKIDDLVYNLKSLSYADKFDPEASGPRSAESTGTAAPAHTLEFTDDKDARHTLGLGKRSVNGIYATLDGGKTIYLLSFNPLETLDKPVTDFRAKLITQLPADTLSSITITQTDQTRKPQTLSLTKSADKWLITAPITSRANPETVDGITNELKNINAARFVALPKDNATGLDNPRVIVTVRTTAAPAAPASAPASGPASAASQPAPALALELGYYTDPVNRKEVYASLAGSSDVFTLSAETFNKLNISLNDLRDPAVLAGDIASATSIAASNSGKPINLSHTNNDWSMTAANLPPVPADSLAVGTFVQELKSLRASKFVDAAGDLKSIGLDPPQNSIDIALPTETRHSVLLLGKPETADNVTPLMLQGEQTVYLVKSDDVAKLKLDPLALRDHAVERLDADRIRDIDVTDHTGSPIFSLHREGKAWTIAHQGKTSPADDTRITTILADFTPVNAAKFLSTTPDVVRPPMFTVKVSFLESTVPSTSQPAAATQASTQAATLPAELQALLNKSPAAIGPTPGKLTTRTLEIYKDGDNFKALWDGPGPEWTFQPTTMLIDHLTKTDFAATQPATQPTTATAPATAPATQP